MSLRLTTAATEYPVTLAEAKLHLRVTGTTDDDLITAMITAATANAEHIMGRAVMPQKWTVTLDNFWGLGYRTDRNYSPSQVLSACYVYAIELQRQPVTAVDSVAYIDPTTGEWTTIDPTLYQLVNGSDYTASVLPAFGQVWPETRDQAEAVKVIFSCGYADATVVPEPIKAWIKLRLGTMFENRESTVVVVGGRLTLVELPFVDTLLEPYKVWGA